MAEPAYLCKFGFSLHTGRWLDVALKAHGPVGSSLKWEWRRLLIACGYDPVASVANTPCYVARKQKTKWQDFFAKIGLDLGSHHGSSARAAQAKGSTSRLDLEAEQKYWFSTAWMLGLLLFWESHRREVGAKGHIKACGQALCSKVLDSDISFDMTHLPVSYMMLCRKAPLVDGCCACMGKYLGSLGHEPFSGQTRAWHCIRALGQFHGSCPSLAAFLGSRLLEVAGHIDGSRDRWGDTDWFKTPDAFLRGARNSRRTDPHVRQWVVQHSLQAGGAANCWAGDEVA